MIEIHYFASVREAMQRSKEQLALPESVTTVADLVSLLMQQDESFRSINQSGNPLLVAVNQTVVESSYKLSEDDEVAFFPPMTGG
ncbi:MAG: molybdopterin converting factor subunit 1 [Pseudomonadales bacterium]|nr:molybdopterin converting factor subunit 1 [Pseudomonadales bacterium]